MSERAGQGRRALDEALRLLDVLQAARPAAPADVSQGAAAAQGPDPAAPGVHTGDECAICPVCRGIAYLRRADPDAVDRIAGAVADLGSALRDLVGADRPTGPAGRPPDDPQGETGDVPGGQVQHVDVQRIDVTDA